jgi:hypothetical protein
MHIHHHHDSRSKLQTSLPQGHQVLVTQMYVQPVCCMWGVCIQRNNDHHSCSYHHDYNPHDDHNNYNYQWWLCGLQLGD